ncbi:MAG: tripartite tricarboxylate transporter TctB family protein [Pseudomonadota bacterium]
MTSSSRASERTSDRLFAIAIFGLAACIFWSTFNPEWFSLADADEARTVLVPRVLLIAMMFLSILLLVRSFLSRVSGAGFTESVSWSDPAAWARFLAATAIAALSAAFMPYFGFYITMVIAIGLLGAAMGLRRWVLLICVTVTAPAVSWYIIVQVAELSLPTATLLGSG